MKICHPAHCRCYFCYLLLISLVHEYLGQPLLQKSVGAMDSAFRKRSNKSRDTVTIRNSSETVGHVPFNQQGVVEVTGEGSLIWIS